MAVKVQLVYGEQNVLHACMTAASLPLLVDTWLKLLPLLYAAKMAMIWVKVEVAMVMRSGRGRLVGMGRVRAECEQDRYLKATSNECRVLVLTTSDRAGGLVRYLSDEGGNDMSIYHLRVKQSVLGR